jgi:hypothetical protein
MRIRGKYLSVHGDDTKRHKTEDISVNNGPTKIFEIITFSASQVRLSQKTSRYCPFQANFSPVYLRRKYPLH